MSEVRHYLTLRISNRAFYNLCLSWTLILQLLNYKVVLGRYLSFHRLIPQDLLNTKS